MTATYPTKLKDPRTCRVFFSSPFGGMEEEREELTRKYFPQIHHLCNSRGIQFVPVDMRWGITSEAAENAQTVNICLRELDRCDIFVGFYGQRYGWHGSEDEKLQQNFDNAVGLYPWLDDFRDRSATELEFLHGHLNNPGALPACFGFRDKKYDNMKAESFEKQGDMKTAIKYSQESNESGEKLQSLRERTANTQEKTLGVHMDYSSPEEGARLMFESFWSHLNQLLQVEESQMTGRLQELIDHNAYMSTRQAVYIGGENYFNQLDAILKTDTAEKVLVTGEAGQGKTALLANWVSHVQETQPETLLVYHFIGANKNSGKRTNILARLISELQEALSKNQEEDSKGTTKEISEQNNNESKGNDKETDKEGDEKIEDINNKDRNREKNEETRTGDENHTENNKETEQNEGEKNDETKDTQIDDLEKVKTNVKTGGQTEDKTDGQTEDKTEKKTDGQTEEKTDGQKDAKPEETTEKKEEKAKEKTEGKKESKSEKKNVKELLIDLQTEMTRSEKGDKRVVLIVDGLDKLVSVGKTIKPVSWLPGDFPPNVKLVVSTKSDDQISIEELVDVRQYQTLQLQDLELEHRTQICVKSLEKSGKALSPAQLEKVVQKEQTKNPLFLKLAIAELAVFGSFRKLDEKIDYLLSSNSVGELCVKFLERLEIDYNTEEMPDIVQLVLQSIAVSQEGMSEMELKEMLDIPSHVWSPLYFALEQFIVIHSNNISFSYSEITKAVNERYLETEEAKLVIIKRIIAFFDTQRKNFRVWPRPSTAILNRPASQLPWLQLKINDKEGLTTTLSDLNVFYALILDNEYALLELWKGTGHKFGWIAGCYIESFDKALADIYCMEKDQYYADDNKPPGQRIMYHLENVRFLMDTASCVSGSTQVIQRIIQLLENTAGVWQGSERMELLMEMKYYLACNMCDTEHYDYAIENHQNVIKYWNDALAAKEAEEKTAETRLAWAYNGLGLARYHKMEYEEAEKLFQQSLTIHVKQRNARNQADSWTNIGLVHLGKKNHSEAVTSFQKALKLYQDHFFDSVPHCIGNLYTNLGLAYRRQNNLDQAEKFYLKSLELKANAVGWDHPVIATAYMNLGTLETHRKNYAKVEVYTLKAINIYKINQHHDDSREYRMCRENLANCYLRQERYVDAVPVFWSVFNALTKLNMMHECLAWVHHTMAKHYLDTADYEKADIILTAVARCNQKRTAKTFLLLDQLNTKWPRPDPPEDLTFDFGLKLFPFNNDIVRHKTMNHYIAQGDIDGLEKWYTSWEAECLDYFTAADWCKEDNKPGFASEIVELCMKKYTDVETLNGYAAGHWFELKQYDKALTYVEKMKVEEEYNEFADFHCSTVLHHFSREEEARKWLKKIPKGLVPNELKTKFAELKEKLGGDAAFK